MVIEAAGCGRRIEMKLPIALVVAVALMGFVGKSYAADEKAPAPAPAPAKDAAKKEKNVRGEVVKVDGAKVTIKTKGDKEVIVTTDDKTQVVIEGNPGKVADLKAGQKVIITPAEGTATKIQVPKPKAKAAAK
jgi:hypothetical protein